MLSFLPKNPNDIMDELKIKFKTRRKSLKLSQIELSKKTDVSLGSLKRFEQSGQISLESLLKVAFVLECLGDFDGVCCGQEKKFESIDEILYSKEK